MEDEQNHYNLAVEDESTDISLTSKSRNDSGISESENSLLEEAVFPATDHLQVACPREFGYTKIYEVEKGLHENDGTKVPISNVSLYFERGKDLEDVNMLEYASLMQVVKKKTEKDETTDDSIMHDQAADGLLQENTKKAGRKSSLQFEYNTGFEMQPLFQQHLFTKECMPFAIGNAPPKRVGKRPLQLNNESHDDYQEKLDAWQKKADAFANYYLLLFRPTSRNWRESDFTYDALETWIESCSTSDNWLNVHRLDAYNSRLNGMSISSTNKRVITGYRGRCRTLWTDEERLNNDEYFTFRHAQQAEDLERSGIGVIEYNLEHSDLGTDANKRMKKQELDISRLQTALKSLFPSLDGPNR